MLVNGIRETLRVAHDAATDATVVLRDFASEVQEVRSWTLETAQREVTALAFGRAPPKKNQPSQAAESERAPAPQKKKQPRQAAESERAPPLHQGSASSSQTIATKNQVRASLRNRGGVGLGATQPLPSPAGYEGVASASSSSGKSPPAPTTGCPYEEWHSTHSPQHETVHEEEATPVPAAVQERGAEQEEQERPPPITEQGDGEDEFSHDLQTTSSLVESLAEKVETEQEEEEGGKDLECTQLDKQQGCAESEETQKLHQKEVAKRQWAEAVKKIRLMREEEEAKKLHLVAALANQTMEEQEDESIISMDQEERYSLEQLTQTKVWQSLGVQPSAREFYLTDEEFKRLFEMDRQDYIMLPKWKRIALKKKHNLF